MCVFLCVFCSAAHELTGDWFSLSSTFVLASPRCIFTLFLLADDCPVLVFAPSEASTDQPVLAEVVQGGGKKTEE